MVCHAAKLAVVTEPREAPGSGPVVIHTKSGGVGVSWINFSFIDSDHGTRATNGNTIIQCGRALWEYLYTGTAECAESALHAELKMYKQQVKGKKATQYYCKGHVICGVSLSTELKDSNKSLLEENEQLHSYIDRLLLGILTHSPGMLEVQSSTTTSLT